MTVTQVTTTESLNYRNTVGGHMSKKAPLTTVNFLLPVTGGHCGPNGKRACFFPVVFQSFESLSVVTDRQTDGRIKGL